MSRPYKFPKELTQDVVMEITTLHNTTVYADPETRTAIDLVETLANSLCVASMQLSDNSSPVLHRTEVESLLEALVDLVGKEKLTEMISEIEEH